MSSLAVAPEPVAETSRAPGDAPLLRVLGALAVAGAVAFAIGLLVSPERAWRGYLTGEIYLVGLGIGAAFFVAIQHVTSAGWSVSLRRVPEAMAGTLPLAAVLFLPVLLGAHSIYEWTHARVVAEDPVLLAKSAWLSLPFFAFRAFVIFAVWIGFSRAIVGRSRRQDQDGSVEHTHASARLSGLFIPAFAVTFSVAAFDWTMSLAPHWFSTIYAVYHFAGSFLSALAAIALLVVVLRRRGVLGRAVGEAHLLDLGRLIFGFSTFWAYIWFSQLMLIWYSNLPEETPWYVGRLSAPWFTLFVVNLAVNWVIPFLVLLPRPNKKNDVVLARVAGLLLLGRWLDLYLDVSQPVLHDGPALGLFEVGPVVGVLAGFALAFLKAFGEASPVPQKDPYLQESLHHHA